MAHLTLEVADLPKRGKHLLPGLIRVNKRVPVPYSWAKVTGDPVVASAMLDRLLHRSVVINIDGSSYRMRAHRARAEAARKAVAGNGR